MHKEKIIQYYCPNCHYTIPAVDDGESKDICTRCGYSTNHDVPSRKSVSLTLTYEDSLKYQRRRRKGHEQI